jgi:DNA-binding transcriptional LysR family regulator
MQARHLDLALLAYLPEDHDLEARLLMRDELVLIVSPRHRLALVSKVHLKDLEKESIIIERAFVITREGSRRFSRPSDARVVNLLAGKLDQDQTAKDDLPRSSAVEVVDFQTRRHR